MTNENRSILLNNDSASSKTILLSKNGTFMFLFSNGAFGSKWTGLWDKEKKFLDYFAFRVNGHWLSPEKLISTKYNGITAELLYQVDQKVKQTISVHGGNLAVRIQTERESEIDLEPGVNIRNRDENLHGHSYTFKWSDKLNIKNERGNLRIFSEGATFTPMNIYEKHNPGKYAREHGYTWDEEMQEKFVPGILSNHGRLCDFSFVIGARKKMDFDSIKKDNRKFIRAKAKLIDWKLANSISLFITKEKGMQAFYAGFPYFNQIWTRDFLWMARPLLNKGFEKEVKSSLELFGRNQNSNGGIPNIIGNVTLNADSTPLWIIAVDELNKQTGKLIQEKRIKAALKFGVRRMRGLVRHPKQRTWMDTLSRDFAIEIQSLWVEAFERGSKIFEGTKYADRAITLWNEIESQYYTNTFFKDALQSPYKFTANSLVPVFFKQVSLSQKRGIVKKAKDELLTEFGLKAVSKNESSNPEKYHERVWGLTTYWGTKVFNALIKKKMLEGFTKFFSSQTLFGMPETISNGKPLGASHQLWSTAFLNVSEEDV